MYFGSDSEGQLSLIEPLIDQALICIFITNIPYKSQPSEYIPLIYYNF